MSEVKQVLITGALGFVGSNLCEFFQSKSSYQVTGCDNLQFGTEENKVERVIYHLKSFEEYSSRELSMYDIIIHAATCNIIFAQAEPAHTVLINDVATAELFSRIAPGSQIIYLSTASVYGDAARQPITEDTPIQLNNVYAMTKYAGERHLAKLHINYTILRLSNVYGKYQRSENPYCGVIGRLMECAMTDKDFTVFGDGSATRDYTHVSDVCRAVEAAIKSPNARKETINIATGNDKNVMQLIQMIKNIPGVADFDVKHHDLRSIDTVKRRCLSPSMAKLKMGWEPQITLYIGLEKTLHWASKKLFSA